MKRPMYLACLVLPLAGLAAGADEKPGSSPDPGRLKRELPGTWECVSVADLPRQISHIKHITPTHYTWVTYDRDRNAILAVSGGTWTLKEGKYEEACEFASDSHPHLRGKTNDFTTNLAGDKWDLKGVPGTEINVDEVWARMKPGQNQKKNTGEPGRQLLGTWAISPGAGAPKAARMLKHVTPTHWTWAIYDRENRMVYAAMGGTWSLRDGAYVEECEFTTDNAAGARGKSYSYEYRLDGDRWTIKGGPDRTLAHDETWTRLKRPNP
jgi:hypothetical protein